MTAQWNAEDYHRNSSQQQVWAHELIDKLNLAGDERVLDIGCGDGKVTAAIAKRLGRGSLVGMDLSPQMVDFARKNFPQASHTNLRFAQADASALQFENQFDVVFSNATLHWIFDHRPVLHGIARALKPGGRTLLQMGGKGNAIGVLATVGRVMSEPAWRGYFAEFGFRYGFHSPEDYRMWLAEAGLETRRVELIPKDMVHNGTDGFAGWFRTTWMPWTQSVPESHREQFIAEVVTRYVADNPLDEQGRVHAVMVRLEVDAAKRR